MESIDIAQLEEAVILFYRSTSQEQAVTHNWLTTVQASALAWQFSWQLMQLDKPQEVQFFGAITLHSKLMKHWHEVPAENREELKHKILQSIIQFAAGPKIVLNRLCIALSAYIVHMLGEWPTAIEHVINTFQSQQMPNVSKEMQLWIMLEVLQAIPEEMQAIHSSVKRTVLRAQIAQQTALVLQTNEAYLQMQLEQQEWNSENYDNMTRSVKCVSIWIKIINFPLENCQNITTLLLKIVNKCYWPCVQDPDEDGCMTADQNDLAEICLKTLVNIIIQPECHLYPKSALLFIRMFLDSLCGITKMEWKRDNNNEDIAMNIYTLFVCAVERHSQLLLNGITSTDAELSELYTRLVTEILLCTDKPGIYPVEESCSSMGLSFWYLLQDEVFSMQNSEQRKKCWEYIKPLYAHLTRILVRKSEQPDEQSIDKWNADDLEQFRCYRQDITDTFMYCYDVLQNEMLDILGAALDETIASIQTNAIQWTKLEACIYSFQSVAEHFGGDESKQIPKLMSILTEIPYDKMNAKLLGTALETIGSYCQWLKENTTFIPTSIDLLVRGLNSSMSAEATLGLKELCRDCQLQMKPYAEPLLDACQRALTTEQMKKADCARLMYSVGKLMSLLPANSIPKYLDIIVSPCFQELQNICQSKIKTAASHSRTIFRLNLISTLFSSLNTELDDYDQLEDLQTEQPVLLVMQKTMPIFRQIAELWLEKQDVLDTACHALRQAVLNLKTSFKPMLQELCCFMLATFQTKCCPPTLELAKTTIVLFYKEDENCKQMMQQLHVHAILHTFTLFESTPIEGFSNISETLETFYGCMTQIIKKLPQSFNEEVIDFNKLIFYALKAITLPENGPIRTGTQFLSHFVMQSRNYPAMTQAIHNTGEEIIRTVIMCVGCVSPRQQVEKFADIFMAMNKKYPAEMAGWLKLALENANFTLVDANERNRYATMIIREKVNKRLLQKYLNDFAIKARGLTEKFQ